MEITKEQQLSLVREIQSLIEENSQNTKILERAQSLAVVVFGILSRIDNDDHSVGFELQDYAYNCLQATKGQEGAKEWLIENRRRLEEAISTKFNTKNSYPRTHF